MNIKVREGGGSAPGTGADVSLQPVEYSARADIHAAALGRPRARAGTDALKDAVAPCRVHAGAGSSDRNCGLWRGLHAGAGLS